MLKAILADASADVPHETLRNVTTDFGQTET